MTNQQHQPVYRDAVMLGYQPVTSLGKAATTPDGKAHQQRELGQKLGQTKCNLVLSSRNWFKGKCAGNSYILRFPIDSPLNKMIPCSASSNMIRHRFAGHAGCKDKLLLLAHKLRDTARKAWSGAGGHFGWSRVSNLWCNATPKRYPKKIEKYWIVMVM